MPMAATAKMTITPRGDGIIIDVQSKSGAIRITPAEALRTARQIRMHAELMIARKDPLTCPWCNEPPVINESEHWVKCMNLLCPAQPKTILTKWNERKG